MNSVPLTLAPRASSVRQAGEARDESHSRAEQLSDPLGQGYA